MTEVLPHTLPLPTMHCVMPSTFRVFHISRVIMIKHFIEKVRYFFKEMFTMTQPF